MTEHNDSDKHSVLFLGSQIAIGGAQRILLLQARWFQEQGYQVKVAYFYDNEGLFESWRDESPFPIINLEGWRKGRDLFNIFRLPYALVRLSILLLKEKFTIVETFTHHANLLGLPLAWATRVPVRFASHHGRVENFSPWMERFHSWIINTRITTGLVAVSKRVREFAIVDEGIDPDKITVISNGIDLPLEINLSDKEHISLRQSLGVKPGDNLILNVGRLSQPKGHNFLIEAIPEVLEHYPNTVFVIAGDGYLRPTLEIKANELCVQDNVRFLGTRTDVPELMSIADLFILPSTREGLPIVILEALRAKLPVIATEVEGVEEIILDGENGLLVPPGNSKALSAATIKLLSNENFRNHIGSAGEQLVQEKYSVDRMCKKYEALFQKMV